MESNIKTENKIKDEVRTSFEERTILPEIPIVLHKAPHLSYYTGERCLVSPPKSFFEKLSYPILDDDYVLANIVLKNLNTRRSTLSQEELSEEENLDEGMDAEFDIIQKRRNSNDPVFRKSLFDSQSKYSNLSKNSNISNNCDTNDESEASNESNILASVRPFSSETKEFENLEFSNRRKSQFDKDKVSIDKMNGDSDSKISKKISPGVVSDTLNERTKSLNLNEQSAPFHAFIKSGYRSKLFFTPSSTRACIVTCGGLCPGLNSIIHSLVKTLIDLYSVEKVFGVEGGFNGFDNPFLELNLNKISGISCKGGTVLGTNRGGFSEEKIIDRLEREKVNILFVIGGDGTHRAVHKLFRKVAEKRLKISVVCLPKSIDNDLGIIDHTFGFYTAVEEARRAVKSVIVEANSQPNCVGLVKVMGREAGYIASAVAICLGNVDLCLLPEKRFTLEEFADKVRASLEKKKKCVVVFAEGIDKALMVRGKQETDAGGNRKMLQVENVLMNALKEKLADVNFTIKFNDPKYMIRSVRPNAIDSVFCSVLGQNAVHGAMAGFTGFTSATVNKRMCMIPLETIVKNSPVVMDVSGKEMERLAYSVN